MTSTYIEFNLMPVIPIADFTTFWKT